MDPQSVPSIQVGELGDGAPLVDVREHDEWGAGHAPGALHIPLGDLPGRLDELPDTEAVYIVCRSGGRSARAAAYLNASGWEAINVDGGMRAWHAEGRELVADDPEAEPEVI